MLHIYPDSDFYDNRGDILADAEHSRKRENLNSMPVGELWDIINYSHVEDERLKANLVEFILEEDLYEEQK